MGTPHRPLRAVTFNVLHGRCAAGAVDVGLLGRTCARLAPDVLGLQEVDVGAWRSGRVDQARAVAAATGMNHVFGEATRLRVMGRYGNALLARGPITEVEIVRLPRHGRSEPRAAITAAVSSGGVGMSVVATHLSVQRAEALEQLEAVVAALVRRPPPWLLLGDLNLSERDVTGPLEAAGLTVAGGGPTFPAGAPRLRIDHVAVAGLTMESVEVPETPCSDHRPVVVGLGVASGAAVSPL